MIYVAESAVLVGDVALGEEVSVWHGAVLRGDFDAIRVGDRSNVQDNCVLHEDAGFPVEIGERVTVGHGCVVHGCEIGDGCVVGMGSTICSGAVLGEGTVTAAGCVVPEGLEAPPGSLLLGVPAKIREIPGHLEERRDRGWQAYVEKARAALPAHDAVDDVLQRS